MKTVKGLMIVIPAAMALTACDGWQKSPSSDLQEMRDKAKVVTKMGPDKPVTITNTVVVEKPVEKIVKETDVTSTMILLTADDEMFFVEGAAKTYKIRAALPVPGASVSLTASNLPAGAVLQPSKTEKDVYELSWTPALSTVESSKSVKSIKVNFVATVTNAGQAKNAATLKGSTKELNKVLFVTKSDIGPSDLKVTGLSEEVSEDQLIPMTVTVTVPGYDGNSTQKPVVSFKYGANAKQTGKDYLELDGSRHIVADLTKPEAEYLGNSKWRFFVVFDTKNIPVQPQLNSDTSIMSQADGTNVHFVVKVTSPNNASTETLVRTKIAYTKTISAPRFDVSGLGKQGLTVSPGEKIVLQFFASTANRNAVVAVETKNSELPGNPQITCATSSIGASKQDCTLTWEVPCDATAKSLNGQIPMAATSTLNGRISDVTEYSLRTVKTAKDKGLCAAPAPAVQPAAKAQSVKAK